MLFIVMIPNYILIFNVLLAVVGIFIGIAILKGYLPAVKWLFFNIGIIIFGIFMTWISTMLQYGILRNPDGPILHDFFVNPPSSKTLRL